MNAAWLYRMAGLLLELCRAAPGPLTLSQHIPAERREQLFATNTRRFLNQGAVF